MNKLFVTVLNDPKKIILSFNTKDVNLDDCFLEVEDYEDNQFKIDQNAVENFLFAYKSKEVLQNNFIVELGKDNIELNPIHLSHSLKQPIQSYRFSLNQIARPYFLKNSIVPSAKLKDYQLDGVDWLLKSPYRILADDMGLGKTLQSIVAASKLITEGKIKNVLIVCPPSLVTNWSEELKKWAPWFCVYTITNTSNHKDEIWTKLYDYSHFIVTNYEQLRETPLKIKNETIDLIIADEAHKIRKATSLIHKGIKSLKYNNFWALTGTPIENNSNDIKNILKIVNPQINLATFPINSPILLRAELKSYLLRRMKSDVLSSIMDFTETYHKISLNPEQLLTYQKILKKFSTSSKEDRLAYFSKLKEICDFDESSGTSSKIDITIELIDKIKSRNEKVVIFSFWLKPLEMLKKKLEKVYKKNVFSVFAGDLNRAERDSLINSFKINNNHFVFLCSGKIGGEGLNLTEANHVIFFNEWWNPSNNSQARDRIIRIGQTRDTYIHHLYTVNTIEENVLDIIKTKQTLNNEVIEKMVLTEIKNLK